MSTRFTIERLGAQGDGIAETETGPVFVPFALPGETVTAARQKDRADLLAVIDPSPSGSRAPAGISVSAAAAPFSIWIRTPTATGSVTKSCRP